MATMNTDEVIENLNKLIELDYDAIAAYKAAIERLDAETYKAKMAEFLVDHERHVRELGDVVRREGATPPDSGDAKKILTKGQVVLANLGGDEAILKAMKKNEDQTNQYYEDASNHGLPVEVQTLVQNGLADERRHRAWLEQTLSGL